MLHTKTEEIKECSMIVLRFEEIKVCEHKFVNYCLSTSFSYPKYKFVKQSLIDSLLEPLCNVRLMVLLSLPS